VQHGAAPGHRLVALEEHAARNNPQKTPQNPQKERQTQNTNPANTPGRERGNVIVKKTRQGEAPSVCAACSNLKSMLSKERRIARTTNGNATTAEANTAPFQLKPKDKPTH